MQLIQKGKYTSAGDATVVVVLDASGSMHGWRKAVIETFNEYLQKIAPLNPLVALYTFDSMGLVELFNGIPARDIVPLTEADYLPNAMTPLFDAIGMTLARHQLDKTDFVVHTDGAENESSEFNLEQVNKLLTERAAKGAQFTWLGEGPGGFAQVSVFAAGATASFSSNNRKAAMGYATSRTMNYTESGKAGEDEVVDLDKPS